MPSLRVVARPVLVTALAAGLAVPSLPAIAGGTGVRCGMVVDEQVVLDRDLRCDGPALVVRNPRTIVQLNGHTLESGRVCAEGASAGIIVEATAEGTQILGPGEIRGFVSGIEIAETPRALVRDLRISDSCARGIVVVAAEDARARNVILHRNGGAAAAGGSAVLLEGAERFVLEMSEIFLNGGSERGAAVELRSSHHCRLAGNRIVGNRGVGLRLDVDSRANEVESNIILDHRPQDVVDEGADNTLALNVFERGDGVPAPRLWPLVAEPGQGPPGVAGCATLHGGLQPRASVTLRCPQDRGLRALRNSVVGYRFLNFFYPNVISSSTCNPAEVHPASASAGGALTCTNPDSIWPVILEITCCLN